jgi:hypothetical protein
MASRPEGRGFGMYPAIEITRHEPAQQIPNEMTTLS